MRTGRLTLPKPARLLVSLSVLVLAAACASEADGDDTASDDPEVEEARDTADTAPREPTATEAPTTTAPTTTTTTLAVVESGTYVVPDQFATGTYRVEGYWARLDANQEITTTTSSRAGSRS
jgi:hypothetical protein